MRTCFHLALLACFGLALVPAAQARDCQMRALDALHATAPDGASVYKRITDKQFFLQWLDCDDPQFELSTAVHESVHILTDQSDAFPLVGGGEAERPHEVSKFFAPSRIRASFGESDYVDTYLKPGRATSSSDFLYLLDELNAYAHDLNAAVDLKDYRQRPTILRPPRRACGLDGLSGCLRRTRQGQRARNLGRLEATSCRGDG